jgi:hypothetical protein
LIDKRWHSNTVDVKSLRVAVCDTIIWWMQKLEASVSTQAVQKFEMERFNLRKVNSVEVRG